MEIASLIVILVCSPNYLKNPYLLAKLVEVMFTCDPAIQHRTPGFSKLLYDHRLSLDHLMPSLMKFYTGELVKVVAYFTYKW